MPLLRLAPALHLGARLSALALLACAAPLLGACSGTGDGGTGDPPSEPDTDRYGDGRRVQDVAREATWYDEGNTDSIDCNAPDRRRTRITGLTVVAVDDFDENAQGRLGNIYTVQTPGRDGLGPYSGMTLRRPGFSPPDLRIFENDVIDVSGDFVEFLGPPSASLFGKCKTLPQMEGTVTIRFDGAEVAPLLLVPGASPSPDVDRWAPLKSYEGARPYIGMLVRLENVRLLQINDNDGELTIPIDVGGGIDVADQPKISNELYDIAGTGPAIADDGATFASITGVVTYFYGFKVAPRSPSDFVRE